MLAKAGGATLKHVFNDQLTSIHKGQESATGGKTLPGNDIQADTIEIRVLATDTSSSTSLASSPRLTAPPRSSGPYPHSSEHDTNHTDLIQEISTFNTHAASVTDKGAELAGHSTIAQQLPTKVDALELSTATPVDRTATFKVAIDSRIRSNSTGQTAQPTEASVTPKSQIEPAQSSLQPNSFALKVTAPTGATGTSGVANPLSDEIQVLTSQAMGKHTIDSSKLRKVATEATSGRDLKIPHARHKQPVIKLVMLEASATLAQWQKVKQIEDQPDSSAEAPSTLLQPESRTLRANPELQTGRLVKTEQDAQTLSQKFAEQLGQRLIQSVQKGHWRAELELHPKSLGRIDVQLDFVNGQLEGHFQTHNPLTRELLQEGLPRLREWLQQTGTQVASLEVNNGNSEQGGEKPTPHLLSGKQNESITEESTAEFASDNVKALDEGFDLLV